MLARREGVEGMGEVGEGNQEVQMSSCKISHRNVKYSIGNVISNNVITLYGD